MALGRAVRARSAQPARAATPVAAPTQGPELSRAFMVRWDMYRQYFPLMALGRARSRAVKSG
jgi:hypothetical protein